MLERRVKTAIVGAGRWGKNVARELRAQSDLAAYAVRGGTTGIPEVLDGTERLTIDQLCDREDLEAVCIATPISTHASLTEKMLSAGKHVMCEKPLAETSHQAEDLAVRADEKKLILMTGYVFVYHPVYRELKKLLESDAISRVECVWNKYGTFTESIEMNLLTHHLSLAYDLLGMPKSGSYESRGAGETACDRLATTLSYDNAAFISHIDRLSPSNEHRITVHTHGDLTYQWQGQVLTKDGKTVFESAEQPLTLEIAEFLKAIVGGDTPRTSGRFGADVLHIHEMLGGAI